MYILLTERNVDRIFSKLARKDPKQLEAIDKKIKQILANPYQFKPLKAPMQHLRRVHVGSYVITYKIKEQEKAVEIWDYDHHDEIYK